MGVCVCVRVCVFNFVPEDVLRARFMCGIALVGLYGECVCGGGGGVLGGGAGPGPGPRRGVGGKWGGVRVVVVVPVFGVGFVCCLFLFGVLLGCLCVLCLFVCVLGGGGGGGGGGGLVREAPVPDPGQCVDVRVSVCVYGSVCVCLCVRERLCVFVLVCMRESVCMCVCVLSVRRPWSMCVCV